MLLLGAKVAVDAAGQPFSELALQPITPKESGTHKQQIHCSAGILPRNTCSVVLIQATCLTARHNSLPIGASDSVRLRLLT